MKKRKQYILFDFDGTITDSRKLLFSSFLEILDRLEYSMSRKKAQSLMGNKIKHMLTELGLDDEYEYIRKSLAQLIMKKVNKKNTVSCVSLDPLMKLYRQGVRFIIVTNNYTSFVRRSLRAMGVNDLFYEVYSTEDLEMTKRDIFEMLIFSHDFNTKKTMYVGDRFSDVRSAQRVGLVSVAIFNEYSWSSLSEIVSENPDYLIHDFEDLRLIFNSLY